MSTTIIPEVSKKRPYYISKHRYYELKHFCLQYSEWKKEFLSINISPESIKLSSISSGRQDTDPTSRLAIRRQRLLHKMERVEQAALQTDGELASFIITAVTKGYSYECLLTRYDIPCSRDYYYDCYRRFFFNLSENE